MILGGEWIERFGKERIESAPARVERLDYGAYWLQLGENPFVARPEELRALAKHFGLKSPV